MSLRVIVVDNSSSSVVREPASPTKAPAFVLFGSLAVLVAIYFFVGELVRSGGPGLPSDASWFNLRLARNLASGYGMSFNPGERLGAGETPLWQLLLAMGGFLSGDYLIAAKVLGVFFLFLAAVFSWRLTMLIVGLWGFALLAGLLVVFSPSLSASAMGGSEGALAAFLLIAAIYYFISERQSPGWRAYLPVVLAGLAALTRPELRPLFPLALLDRLLSVVLRRRNESGARWPDFLRWALLSVVIYLAVLAPSLLLNHSVTGRFLARTGLEAASFSSWLRFFLTRWLENPALLLLFLPGLFVVFVSAIRPDGNRASLLPALSVLVFPALLGLGPTGRVGLFYESAAAFSLLPLYVVVSVCGVFLLHRILFSLQAQKQDGRGRLSLGFAWLAALAMLGLAWFRIPQAWEWHSDCVRNINQMHVAIGRWALTNLPPEAVIAADDPGAIAHISQRKTVDLAKVLHSQPGLTARGETPNDGEQRPGDRLASLLSQAGVDYVVMYPKLHPSLAAAPDRLEQVFEVSLNENPAARGSRMVVYQVRQGRRTRDEG